MEKQHLQVLQPNYLLIFQVSYNPKICCRERHTKSSKAQVVQSSAKHIQNPFEVLFFSNSFNEVDYESEKKITSNGYFTDAASFKKNLGSFLIVLLRILKNTQRDVYQGKQIPEKQGECFNSKIHQQNSISVQRSAPQTHQKGRSLVQWSL